MASSSLWPRQFNGLIQPQARLTGFPNNPISASCKTKRASPSLNALQAFSKAKVLFIAKSKASGEATTLFSAKF